jgi:hypothetical protein
MLLTTRAPRSRLHGAACADQASRGAGGFAPAVVTLSACAIFAAIVTTVAIPVAAAATDGSAVRAVRLLPLGDRASIVIEFAGDVAHAKQIKSKDDESFVVDIGPVEGPVAAETLRAAPTAPLVREVRVQGLPQAANEWIVRVHVRLHPTVSGSIRTANRRVYLDFARAAGGQRPAMLSASSEGAGTSKRAPAVDTGTAGAAPVVPPSAGASGLPEEDVLARARALARIPDVKALIALKTTLQSGNGGASNAPGVSGPSGDGARRVEAIATIDELLAEAQQLQLAKDARLFRQMQIERFGAAMRGAAFEIAAADNVLRSPSPQPGAISGVRAQLEQLAARLKALQALPDLSAAHAELCAALDAAVTGLSSSASGNEAQTSPTGVTASLDRARAAIAEMVAAVKPAKS